MFKNWKWSDTEKLFYFLLIAIALIFIVTIFFEPKNIDYYYLKTYGDFGKPRICVESHWTWHFDGDAYCTNDKNDALEFLNKVNTTLPHQK